MPKSNNSSNKYIYMDYAASVSANPSSIHRAGVEAKIKLQNSRKEVSSILGARPEEIIFTSGGTESNNLAIQGVAWAWLEKEYGGVSSVRRKLLRIPHIITTNIEHPSVLETYKLLAKRKLAKITIVPVEANGIIDPKKIRKEIKKNTVLVSVMCANNEIGTIQPIKEIAKVIRFYRKTNFTTFPLFHTDAVQAVNYLDLNVEKLGVDLLSLSGSKIEGATPKGGQAGRVGVLYKKKTVKLAKVFGGGDQEGAIRPGTENLPEVLKFSSALKLTQEIKEQEIKRLTKLRDYFMAELLSIFSNSIANGDLENRLPNNVNVTFSKIPSDLLVIELSAKGVMISAKSACKSGESGGSDVIKAIRQIQGLQMQGKTLQDDIGGVRFSLGRDTTKKDIDYTVKVLSNILTKLKKWY